MNTVPANYVRSKCCKSYQDPSNETCSRCGVPFEAEEAVEHCMQRTVENVPQKFSYCGWCGFHREGDPNDGAMCLGCGGHSWLPCSLGCLEHSTVANA